MDRNQVIGIVIISAMLMAYMYFGQGEQPQQGQQTSGQVADSTTTETTSKDTTSQTEEVVASNPYEGINPDSLRTAEDSLKVRQEAEARLLEGQNEKLRGQYGDFAGAATGESKSIILENSDVRIEFSTKGANPIDVKLKKYTPWNDSTAITLLDTASNKFTSTIKHDNKKIVLEDLFFNVEGKGGFVEEGNSKSVTFKLPAGSGKYIQKTYTLSGTGYELGYNIEYKGLDGVVEKSPLTIVWDDKMKRTEQGVAYSVQKSWFNYYTKEEGFDDFLGDSTESPQLNGVRWIANKQRFFNAGLIATGEDNFFRVGQISCSRSNQTDEKLVQYILRIKSTIELPYGDLVSDKGQYKFYFGPNDYEICTTVAEDYKENIYMGWKLFGFINENLVRPLFNIFGSMGISYGIVILLTVIVIKLLLFPIAFRSYKAMAKMKVLKPWIEEIKKKHGDNKQAAQMEQMKLYRQVGANPISGCVPQLLQIPIFLSLFNFFPNYLPLRHESFLWAHDLSSYDAPISWDTKIWAIGDHISLFTVLMTLSTLAYTWYNNQINATSGPMKNIGYIMPVMFFFILNDFAAALTYYYFLNTLITIGQQNLAMNFIDKDKIRSTMEENRRHAQESGGNSGGGKKSKFMQRLEEAQKVAEERRKNKKKK